MSVQEPKVYMACTEPAPVEKALMQPYWKSSMIDEYLALLQNNTWFLVDLPSHRQAIGCK